MYPAAPLTTLYMRLRATSLAEIVVVSGMRLVPRRLRFAAMLILARLGAGLFGLLVVRHIDHRMGTARDYLLTHLLGVLDTHRVEFDIPIDATGLDGLVAGASEGRGVLLVTAHTNAGLARVVLRLVYDVNLKGVVMSSGTSYPICGLGRHAPTVQPSSNSLVAVRSRFREGAVVCAMIDRLAPPPRSGAVSVATSHDPFFVADPLLQVAAKWEVPVALVRAAMKGRRVRLEVEMVRGTGDELVARFAEFTRLAPMP